MKLLRKIGWRKVGKKMYTPDGELYDDNCTYEQLLEDYGEVQLALDLGEIAGLSVTITYRGKTPFLIIETEPIKDVKEYVRTHK